MTIIMNDDEIRVENFLRERSHNDVICWPDGPNEPPDFLIEGSIAIEVRRLNQNHAAGFETQGLEVVSKKLIDSIRSIALSLGPPTRGRSWFVSIDFRRPVGELKTLRALITEKLRDFIARDCHQEITFRISDTVAIQIAPSEKMHRTFFVIGGWVDGDSGGWLIPEMTKNISLCVDEKARKIARVRHKYPQWWLILVDHVSPGLDEDDCNQIRELLAAITKWDKVIILDRDDSARSFAI